MVTKPAVPVRGKLLVIDDNPIIQRAVYFALRDHGYKVLMCGEVTEALKMIRVERPDLVLVDLSFPADTMNIGGPMHDGFFIIDWIRRTEEIEAIPVIIISGTAPSTYAERIASLGIKACLHKPLKKEELLAAVQAVLAGSTADGLPDQS